MKRRTRHWNVELINDALSQMMLSRRRNGQRWSIIRGVAPGDGTWFITNQGEMPPLQPSVTECHICLWIHRRTSVETSLLEERHYCTRDEEPRQWNWRHWHLRAIALTPQLIRIINNYKLWNNTSYYYYNLQILNIRTVYMKNLYLLHFQSGIINQLQ